MKLKEIIAIGFISLLGLLSFSSCDKIEKGEEREITEGGLSGWNGKVVVLEDFTGVQCVNCPKAADAAKAIKALMGEKLILIELHTTGQSLTAPYRGDADLRSEVAKTYFDYWQVNALPSGMINRKQQPGKVMTSPDTWMGVAMEVFKEIPEASLEASASFSGNKINISVSGKFTSDTIDNGDIHVITMILEDGFAVTQLFPGGVKKEGYMHDHVLRTVADGEWGVKVAESNPNKGDNFSHSASVDINEIWKKDKLSVVVLLCNNQTKEILQAAHAEIK